MLGGARGIGLSRSGRGHRFVAAACLVALVLVTSGAVVGIALAPEPSPTSLLPGPTITSVRVAYESFDDVRRMPFTLVAEPRDEIRLSRAGTVTSLACEVGGTLASGDVPLSIDSTPVAALHTAYPLWRDLSLGDTGPDVAALQSELGRLGYPAGRSGTMDRRTARALTSFFTDREYARPDSSLRRDAVLWLPARELAVADCALKTAMVVQHGDTFVTTGGGLAALRPALPAEGLAPGARTISFGDVAGPVQPDGGVTDPAFLAAVAASPDYARAMSQAQEEPAQEGSAGAQMTFTTALATPLNTAVLPAAALFGVSQTSGCISSDGVALPVTIVASMLGSTYVTIDNGSTPTTVDLNTVADRTDKAGTCT